VSLVFFGKNVADDLVSLCRVIVVSFHGARCASDDVCDKKVHGNSCGVDSAE